MKSTRFGNPANIGVHMIFDKFCGLVERHFPVLLDTVADAKIFYFPALPHEVLPKEVIFNDYKDTFFLPFQTVVIEDKGSMILLVDDAPDTIGLSERRLFIECMPVSNDYNNYSHDYIPPGSEDLVRENFELMAKRYAGHYLIHIGTIKLLPKEDNPEGFMIDGSLHTSHLVSKRTCIKTIEFNPDKEAYKEMGESAIRNAATAIEEIMFFNVPSRFILEEAPTKISPSRFTKSGSLKRLLRSPDRPLYTLLTPFEIRAKLGLTTKSEKEGGTVEGHYRRRHFRTLRSDVFTHMKDKRIVVSATWVGESEVERGGKRYKIMLEL
jgi:hypothetical protein